MNLIFIRQSNTANLLTNDYIMSQTCLSHIHHKCKNIQHKISFPIYILKVRAF